MFEIAELFIAEAAHDSSAALPNDEEVQLFEKIATLLAQTQMTSDWYNLERTTFLHDTPISQVLSLLRSNFMVAFRKDDRRLSLLSMRTVVRWMLDTLPNRSLNLETSLSEVSKYRDVANEEWAFLNPQD